MTLRLRKASEALRSSLFFISAIYVVAGAVLGGAATALDGRRPAALEDAWFLIPATVESTRGLLAAHAGATITVAGVVFAVVIVALQLASSQFSPRVLRGCRRDRVQRHMMAGVIGVFTFAIVAVADTAALRADEGGEQVARSATVTIAVVLAVVAILAIIAFIDRRARTMQVTEVTRRITVETRQRIAALLPEEAETNPEVALDPSDPEGSERRLRALHDGWVQQIDDAALLGMLPAGTVASIDVCVGDFVVEDQAIRTLWIPEEVLEEVDHAEPNRRAWTTLAVGGYRTMQQDIAFGLRQLVDIGLRALSSGINDPTTAYEVMVNIVAVLRDILVRELPPRGRDDDEGRRVVRAADLTHDESVVHAFDQIRLAASPQPVAPVMLLEQLASLAELLQEAGRTDRLPALCQEAELTADAVEAEGALPTTSTRCGALQRSSSAARPRTSDGTGGRPVTSRDRRWRPIRRGVGPAGERRARSRCPVRALVTGTVRDDRASDSERREDGLVHLSVRAARRLRGGFRLGQDASLLALPAADGAGGHRAPPTQPPPHRARPGTPTLIRCR